MDFEDVEIGEEFEKDGKRWLKIDEVMEDQKDLVDIVHTLKQVMCIKG